MAFEVCREKSLSTILFYLEKFYLKIDGDVSAVQDNYKVKELILL